MFGAGGARDVRLAPIIGARLGEAAIPTLVAGAMPAFFLGGLVALAPIATRRLRPEHAPRWRRSRGRGRRTRRRSRGRSSAPACRPHRGCRPPPSRRSGAGRRPLCWYPAAVAGFVVIGAPRQAVVPTDDPRAHAGPAAAATAHLVGTATAGPEWSTGVGIPRAAALRFLCWYRVSCRTTQRPTLTATRPPIPPSAGAGHRSGLLARHDLAGRDAMRDHHVRARHFVVPASYPAGRATRRAQLVTGGVRRLRATLVRPRPSPLRELPPHLHRRGVLRPTSSRSRMPEPGLTRHDQARQIGCVAAPNVSRQTPARRLTDTGMAPGIVLPAVRTPRERRRDPATRR